MDCCCCTTVVGGTALVFLLLYLYSIRRRYSVKGKHVLITGGSSGIGKAIAVQALKRGASHVTLLARNEDKLQKVKKELETAFNSQTINTISVDVSQPDSEITIKELLKEFPRVDVLVNSAGITHTDSFIDTQRNVFESLFNTNVFGGVSVTRAVLPSMIEDNGGHIVFISSQAGQFPMYGYTAYSASKFALRGLAQVLDMELRPYNVRVSISFPPDTDTPQLEAELKDRSGLVKELAAYSTRMKPEQVANEVLAGIERQVFSIHHSFDGFILKILTGGTGPLSSLWDLLTQVILMGVFRLVAIGYLFQFNRIIRRSIKKNN